MLMITQIQMGDSTSTLKLEGKLREPLLDELWAAYEGLHRPPGQIHLDLSGLTFIDAAGIRLLEDLIRQGVTITACSGFVAEMLNMGQR